LLPCGGFASCDAAHHGVDRGPADHGFGARVLAIPQSDAQVLGEFSDVPDRYATAKSRRNYAGTSPIARASGTRQVVLARHARNKRLADVIYLWAFAALTASPGRSAPPDPRPAQRQPMSRLARRSASSAILSGRDNRPSLPDHRLTHTKFLTVPSSAA